MKRKIQCRRIASVLSSEDYKQGQTSIIRIPCKQWVCPICGPKLLSKWKHHLLKTLSSDAMKDKQWCFLTITLKPVFHNHKTPSEGVTQLQGVWKALYMKMRRRVGGRLISYVYFYEGHKSGTYHMHVILDIGIEYDRHPYVAVWLNPSDHHPLQRWLKDLLPTLGAGWAVDLRRIRAMNGWSSSVGIVLYAVKYMAKAKQWKGFKKGARRVGSSQDVSGINAKRQKSRSSWEIRHGISRDEYFKRDKAFYLVADDKPLTLSDYEGEYYYPPLED